MSDENGKRRKVEPAQIINIGMIVGAAVIVVFGSVGWSVKATAMDNKARNDAQDARLNAIEKSLEQVVTIEQERARTADKMSLQLQQVNNLVQQMAGRGR